MSIQKVIMLGVLLPVSWVCAWQDTATNLALVGGTAGAVYSAYSILKKRKRLTEVNARMAQVLQELGARGNDDVSDDNTRAEFEELEKEKKELEKSDNTGAIVGGVVSAGVLLAALYMKFGRETVSAIVIPTSTDDVPDDLRPGETFYILYGRAGCFKRNPQKEIVTQIRKENASKDTGRGGSTVASRYVDVIGGRNDRSMLDTLIGNTQIGVGTFSGDTSESVILTKAQWNIAGYVFGLRTPPEYSKTIQYADESTESPNVAALVAAAEPLAKRQGVCLNYYVLGMFLQRMIKSEYTDAELTALIKTFKGR